MSINATQRVIMRLADIQGKTGTTSFRIAADGGSDPSAAGSAYATVLDPLTACFIIDAIGQTATNTGAGAVATNAYNARDKLRVEYVGSQNDKHVMDVPDPDPAVFDPANFKDVDPTSSAWLSLKSAIQANVKDRLGSAVVVVRGYRQMSRHLKSSRRFA